MARACRARGDLPPNVRAELAPDLSDGDFEAGAQRVSEYIRHLAALDRGLISEEYFLVLQLAEEASLIHALAPEAIESKRGQVESDLGRLIAPFCKWLSADLQKLYADSLYRWPFPELISQHSAIDASGRTI